MNTLPRITCWSVVVLVTLLSAPIGAEIVRFDVQAVTPEPDGYERITGWAFGAVDPAHPLNAIIQDIRLAPRNEGRVEYATQFTVLRPAAGGNGLLFYEVPNVGLALSELPGFYAGIGQLARQRGYTLVFSGWQDDLLPLPGLPQHHVQTPVATRKGAVITGRVRTLYMPPGPVSTLFLAGTTVVPQIAFEPVDLLEEDALLTRRLTRDDVPEPVARGDWAFADCNVNAFPGDPSPLFICLRDGFDPRFIYELVYTAKNPRVRGLGFAATRDLVSFLRYAATDATGTPNPVAGNIRRAVSFGASLSSTYSRQFLHLGFNEDEAGRRVFDGMNAHIAPARNPLNVRFAVPQTPPLQHAAIAPEVSAPFSTYQPTFDPVSGTAGWILGRCVRSHTCPKLMETLSSTEYWQFRASLSTTGFAGWRDLRPDRRVRTYLIASASHVFTPEPLPLPQCQQLSNPLDHQPTLRALLVALERWVLAGEQPPASRIPTIRDGTLVPAEDIGWPPLPGVIFNARFNTLDLYDFGRRFDPEDLSGVLREPPVLVETVRRADRPRWWPSSSYRILLPRVDADGNDIAGIRPVEIAAPTGTHTGWNLRAPGFGEGELCDLDGSFIPFAETAAERSASGDPRPSLEERYGTHAGYVEAVREAAEELVTHGLLLGEDAEVLIGRAEESNVLR